MRIALLGGEDRAEALAALATAAGAEVVAWSGTAGRLRGSPPDHVRTEASLQAIVDEADLLFVDVPAQDVRELIRALKPGPQSRLVLVSRGVEAPAGTRLSEVVSEESACLRIGALAGPILPSEVRRKSPCAAVIASSFREVQDAVSAALHSPMCRIYPSDDLPGVELSGAIVEVVAAALGAARGLGMGVGLQAMVVTRGIAEGGRLCAKVGGSPQTFAGLAGAGELVASITLPDHPAQQRGLALARGENDPALAALCDTLLRRCADLPITFGVGKVAKGELKAADAMSALLKRSQRDERERPA